MSVEIIDGCDVCGEDHETEYCPELGLADAPSSQSLSRARLTLPHFVEVKEVQADQLGVVASQTIAAKTRLGPYEARKTTQNIVSDEGFVLKILIKDGTGVSLDTTDENECNWLCLVQTASSLVDQNCMAIQIGTELFYSTTKEVAPGEELRVWYAPHYARKIGKTPEPDGKTRILLGLFLSQEVTEPIEADFISGDQTSASNITENEQHSPRKTNAAVSNNLKTTTQKQRVRDPEYICPDCNITFPNQYILDQHRVVHRTAVKIENFGDRKNDPPMNVPDEEAERPADDPFTKMTPSTADALNTLTDPRSLHVKYQQSDEGTKKCLRCDKQFTDIQKLAKHVQQHILQDERDKIMAEDIQETSPPGPRKRGRPRGSKNKKFVSRDDDDEVKMITPIRKKPKVIHTYSKPKPTKVSSPPMIKSNDDSANVRKSSRIKAGMESGKINLATRAKLELDEIDEASMVSPKPKSISSNQTPAVNKRGRPRNQPGPVITIDGDSRDASTSFKKPPTSVSKPASGQAAKQPVERPSLETLLKSPLSSLNNHGISTDQADAKSETPQVNATANEDAAQDSSQDVTQDNIVAQSDPQSGEVTLSLPDNPTSSNYISSLINLDDIDIMQKDTSSQADTSADEAPVNNSAEDSSVDEDAVEEGQSPNDISHMQDDSGEKENVNGDDADVDDEHEDGEVVFGTADGQYTCSVCNEFIGGSDQLSKHKCKNIKLEKEALSIFTCEICNKSFDKENYLKRHVEGHETSSTCDDCGKVYSRKESLKNHICQAKIKSDGGPQKKHFCEFCGAAFANEKYLARHMSSHTGEFACVKCDRSFARKESLLVHMKKCDPESLKESELGFPCSLCHKVFSREVSLQNHMAVHNEEFKCSVCEKAFSSAIRLSNHQCAAQDVDPDGELYTCAHEGCGKQFTKELYLTRHNVIHTGQFSCVICNRRYGRKEELIKHMLECTASVQVETMGEIVCTVCNKKFADAASFRVHFQEHTHPYKCNDCGKMFLRRINYDSHREKCIPWDGEPVSCEKCGKKFRTPLFLQRHSVVHDEPKYKCDTCGKKFHRLDYYNDHMCLDSDGKKVRIRRSRNKTEVGDKKPQHICPTCGKSYVSVSNLNKHMVSHGDKTEICEICHKKFHLKISLNEHMKMVHTDKYNYSCKHCGKKLKCRNSMYGHIAQFHAKTLVLYQCNQCGKRFRQKGNLKKHALTHSDKRTYSCKYCSKTFKFPEQIRRHELLHTHGHRFKCDMCDKMFVMEFEKRKHMATYHGGIVYVCKYCHTDCHHFHTMKRHLQRRHYDVAEWQTDTPKFIQGLIKSDESDEYHSIKKERGEQVGLMYTQPATGTPIEIQGLSPEASHALLNTSTGQIQIITRPLQNLLTGEGGPVVVDETQQLVSDEHVQIISDQSELNAFVDVTSEDQIVGESHGVDVIAHAEEEQNTVVLVTQPDMSQGEEEMTEHIEAPITVDQGAVDIPGMSLTDGQGPYIVAEVQGINPGVPSQTFIIQGSLDNLDSDFLTKEMAEAIQSLSNSGALGSEQRIIQIGDVMAPEEILTNQTIFVSPQPETEDQSEVS